MQEEFAGHLYDYPKYYDLVYGSDWKAEFEFLTGCFEQYIKKPVKTLFEPACGTGRLLIKFAQAGYQVSGNDLNEKAVAFCNDRLERGGFPRNAFVGDMADFTLKKPVDAAFNMINSFRHLLTEELAEAHLHCLAAAVKPGGLYCLGLHLTPTQGERIEEEAWSASRGHLTVISSLWSIGLDARSRQERIGMTFDVYTPTRQFRITDEMTHRTYTAAQMQSLLDKVEEFELLETFDFTYDLSSPVPIGPATEDVVYVLRRR